MRDRTMDELRVAVVGVGRMGMTHAENLAHRVRGARLVAVTTSSAERADEVRRRCGAVSVYGKIDHLLEGERLDAVVISSSTSAHVANIESCSAAGLHVLCEKPLALDLEGCHRVARSAKASGVKLMLGHVRRFDSGYQAAQRMIESGAIGRPLIYRSISGDANPPPPEFADLGVSGGLILDSMYHDIYIGRWLMNDEVVRVFGEGGALVDDEVGSVGDVDNAVVSVRFEGGSMGTLTASRTTRYGHDIRGEVIGERGAVQIGRLRRTPVRLLDASGVHHDAVFTTPERMGDAFVTMVQEFVDCLIEDRTPPVGVEDGVATLGVALAGRLSIETGQPVAVAELLTNKTDLDTAAFCSRPVGTTH
ncbi:MAG: Gfo/Idh/MocA family oxidoreductase [Acidobacteriota bacterium]|nr:Gfo/Idh/MocA family oxidoreductase [Acidobacteriota bacterium]